MPAHERELAERANAEVLRQIEESLAHSRVTSLLRSMSF
jgi:hypothetical protein